MTGSILGDKCFLFFFFFFFFFYRVFLFMLSFVGADDCV